MQHQRRCPQHHRQHRAVSDRSHRQTSRPPSRLGHQLHVWGRLGALDRWRLHRNEERRHDHVELHRDRGGPHPRGQIHEELERGLRQGPRLRQGGIAVHQGHQHKALRGGRIRVRPIPPGANQGHSDGGLRASGDHQPRAAGGVHCGAFTACGPHYQSSDGRGVRDACRQHPCAMGRPRRARRAIRPEGMQRLAHAAPRLQAGLQHDRRRDTNRGA